jgi:hypothetical protein
MAWLDFALNPFPELFAAPPGGVCMKAKDALLTKRRTDDQIAVAYEYLTRTDHDVMRGMLGLATYGGRKTASPPVQPPRHNATRSSISRARRGGWIRTTKSGTWRGSAHSAAIYSPRPAACRRQVTRTLAR